MLHRIIFSVNKGLDVNTDLAAECIAMDYMAHYKIEYKSVIGRYQGVNENSYLVSIKDSAEYIAITTLARAFNQESILELDADNQASLLFLKDNKTLSIGVFTQVTKDEALASNGYSLIHGVYYIVKGIQS